MELMEISLYEAELNDLPASEPGEGELRIWYALEDEGKYLGFMEITEYEGISEISYFMIPDLYQGNGYGAKMLEMFLDKYISESKPESMLTALFEYYGDYGQELANLFSSHGFDIGLSSMKEFDLPFETVYKKLSSKKMGSYKGTMRNLNEGSVSEVIKAMEEVKESSISAHDILRANKELSVVAIGEDGKIDALMLAQENMDRTEVIVTDLYTAADEDKLVRRFLAFAVENANGSSEIPDYITFVAVNEKLEMVMDTIFEKPVTSEFITADAEFNLGKYIEQLKLADALRR